jgi:ribosome-associated toxin RatA of RatAB toxin-antitoxin module
MEVRRLLLVTHPAERMYDLIEAAEHYPAFLPWCASATITERSEAIVAADIVVDWHGVRVELATRNVKRRPEWMGVRLSRGPFREFEGEWRLTPLGEEGCRIAFALRYDFSTPLLSRVASPVFERITSTLVDAFVARADALGPLIPAPAPVIPARGAAPAPPVFVPADPPAPPAAPAAADPTSRTEDNR